MLVKLNKVVGTLYLPDKPAEVAVISLGGVPSLGDSGASKSAKVCNKLGVAFFAPDYIGFCRSAGNFSFKGCVKTIQESADFLSGKTDAVVAKTNKKLKLTGIKKLVLFGGSFGGAISCFADLLEEVNINDVVLNAPITDFRTLDFPGTAEPVEAFENLMRNGLKNLYRGYEDSEFPKIFRGKMPELNPIENTKFMKGKNVFVFHGDKDKSILYKDSAAYVKKLEGQKICKSVSLTLMKNFGHSPNLGPKSIEIALKKILIK